MHKESRGMECRLSLEEKGGSNKILYFHELEKAKGERSRSWLFCAWMVESNLWRESDCEREAWIPFFRYKEKQKEQA